MRNSPAALVRCAIYTRKSTEHGLELEFNSLDAQREACEAFIKSQAANGWKALPDQYDDPAYSGGNMDRPALKRLLADIEAGKVDTVVVYKIDRLTRSLSDFAKLVEIFDARSVSFVAITQQFNTTTSMGRLTLNILLSFAQFERELASERVKDKVAASRRKGKWTGGSVPLGYDAANKKLVINDAEAKTVRYIFKRYLELKSFSALVDDLNAKGITTKRRKTEVAKYQGGIPFTYGPLAHFLKNRVYLGEVGHAGKWYPGEHKAVVDRKTFDQVQTLLATNATARKTKRTTSGALLAGKLFDDRGNRMSPSYSVKNGVRYRFYVSSALLRGRKKAAGSVARVPAQEIEAAVLQVAQQSSSQPIERADLAAFVAKVTLMPGRLQINFAPAPDGLTDAPQIDLPWSPATRGSPDIAGLQTLGRPDPALAQIIARSHALLQALTSGQFESIEDLAGAANLNANVVRQTLQLAFLRPDITEALLAGQDRDGLSATKLLIAAEQLSWRFRGRIE